MQSKDVTMAEVLAAKNSYLRDFVGTDLGEPTEGPQWLQDLRAAAAERFAALGLPTRVDEEFRFTNVSPIAETPFRRASQAEAPWTASPTLTTRDCRGAGWYS